MAAGTRSGSSASAASGAPLTTRIVGTAQTPVSTAGLGSVVTGVAGASVTSLVFNIANPTLEDTRIAYYAVGSQAPGLYLISPSGTDSTRVWLNGYGNSEPTWSADGTRLLADGSVRAVFTPGHTHGHTSYVLRLREREVLIASRTHDTIAQLARRLHLSEGTVRNHLSSVIQKLGARNRGEAAEIAERKGWL